MTTQYITLSKLIELRGYVEAARTASFDDAIYKPLNKAAAIIDVYLIPSTAEIKVEVEREVA